MQNGSFGLGFSFFSESRVRVEAQVLPASSAQSAPNNAEPRQLRLLRFPNLCLCRAYAQRRARSHGAARAPFYGPDAHLHPMVETYLQDLKNDSTGNPLPVKDQYFLGRLDLSDGPRMSRSWPARIRSTRTRKINGSLFPAFLPWASRRCVLDTIFQKRYYDFHFVRREFSREIRCLGHRCETEAKSESRALYGRIWVEDQDYKSCASTAYLFPSPSSISSSTSTAGA